MFISGGPSRHSSTLPFYSAINKRTTNANDVYRQFDSTTERRSVPAVKLASSTTSTTVVVTVDCRKTHWYYSGGGTDIRQRMLGMQHKYIYKRTGPVISREPWTHLQVDLIDFHEFADVNDDYKWLLTCVCT